MQTARLSSTTRPPSRKRRTPPRPEKYPSGEAGTTRRPQISISISKINQFRFYFYFLCFFHDVVRWFAWWGWGVQHVPEGERSCEGAGPEARRHTQGRAKAQAASRYVVCTCAHARARTQARVHVP